MRSNLVHTGRSDLRKRRRNRVVDLRLLDLFGVNADWPCVRVLGSAQPPPQQGNHPSSLSVHSGLPTMPVAGPAGTVLLIGSRTVPMQGSPSCGTHRLTTMHRQRSRLGPTTSAPTPKRWAGLTPGKRLEHARSEGEWQVYPEFTDTSVVPADKVRVDRLLVGNLVPGDGDAHSDAPRQAAQGISVHA